MAKYRVTVDGQTQEIEAESPEAAAKLAMQPRDESLTGTVNRGFREYFAKPVTSAVASAIGGRFTRPEEYSNIPGTNGQELAAEAERRARRGAELVVPQTPLEAGATIGTLGAAGIASKAGLTGLAAATTRVAGGAAGGELGGLLSGETPGKGTLIGGGSVAIAEGLTAAVSKILRSLGPTQARMVNEFTERLGSNIEHATGGILSGARTPADLDGLVHGVQGPGGRLVTGRRILGDFYDSKVQEAATVLRAAPGRGTWSPTNRLAIGGDDVLIPSLSDRPMPLRTAIDSIKNIAASQSAMSPTARTQVGLPARQLRAQAWAELDDYLRSADPSGLASAAIAEARSKFALGVTLLEAVKESKAITRRPNEISFDSSKFQAWVSNHRDKIVESFVREGNLDGLRNFFSMVYRGAPVGTQDVLSRLGGMADAPAQLMRSGGGAGTTVVAPARTLLPGLGSQFTGRAPYVAPEGAKTLVDLFSIKAGRRYLPPDEERRR